MTKNLKLASNYLTDEDVFDVADSFCNVKGGLDGKDILPFAWKLVTGIDSRMLDEFQDNRARNKRMLTDAEILTIAGACVYAPNTGILRGELLRLVENLMLYASRKYGVKYTASLRDVSTLISSYCAHYPALMEENIIPFSRDLLAILKEEEQDK